MRLLGDGELIESLAAFQDVQQTQPIFEEDDEGQKSYNGFDDPMQKHVQEKEKDVLVQKTMSPAVQVQQQQEEVTEKVPEGNEKAGFWKKFGDKAKGIFG